MGEEEEIRGEVVDAEIEDVGVCEVGVVDLDDPIKGRHLGGGG